MKYRYWAALGGVCLAAATIFERMHLGEDNSPLVFGPALLGFSAFVSPLILGWAKETAGDYRPGGRAILQSFLFPLIGGILTLWGLLAQAGMIPMTSFDGPRQHCRKCKTNWILEGKRDGRLHYVDACETCSTWPALTDEIASMYGELCARLPQKGEGAHLMTRLKVANFSPVRVWLEGMDVRLSRVPGCAADFSYSSERPLELRVDLRGELPAGASGYPLKARLSIFDVNAGSEVGSVEREKTLPGPTPNL